jgi:hypothetical protein
MQQGEASQICISAQTIFYLNKELDLAKLYSAQSDTKLTGDFT